MICLKNNLMLLETVYASQLVAVLMKLNEATMQIIFIRIPEGTTVASG
jgi:hypothetical protein